MQVLDFCIHGLLVLLLPPLLIGVINKTKAWFAGRVGPPLVQPYRDLRRLWHKGSVFSRSTTWMIVGGPVVALCATWLASALIPFGQHAAPISFAGDLMWVVYLFALGRFALAAAALDTGSAFEGMGTARDLTYACLCEPAVLFGLLVLARLSGSLELSTMLQHGQDPATRFMAASLVLVVLSWFLVLLAENCRIPIDDPNTHLELTMIHEVMVLDHSGPTLGILQYTAALKMLLFGALLERLLTRNVVLPGPVDWLLFVAVLLLLAVLVGVVESTMARLRLLHVPNLLVTACVMSGFGLLLLFV